jgi:hypothetical protein
MENVPEGWLKRRSGLVVPRSDGRGRRLPSVGRLVIAAVLLASPVAHGVSDVLRAAVDVVTVLRLVLSGDGAGSAPTTLRNAVCPEGNRPTPVRAPAVPIGQRP